VTTPEVLSFDPATGISRGASFTVTHVCPDKRQTDLYWDNEAVYERTWLMCPRCRYAVQLVTRDPDGKVFAPVSRETFRPR
jgi:uncharacterized radical SAM superfamily Fe-S cluster-containing enzyme